MSNTPNKTTDTDRDLQVKLEALSQIAEFINDGGGSFRKFIDYLDLDYCDAFDAGGMLISNAVGGDCGLQEKKITILKQWRDWHWHMHIYHEIADPDESKYHQTSSRCYQQAYRIMIGNLKSAPTVMKGYEDINYGEYPGGNNQ